MCPTINGRKLLLQIWEYEFADVILVDFIQYCTDTFYKYYGYNFFKWVFRSFIEVCLIFGAKRPKIEG